MASNHNTGRWALLLVNLGTPEAPNAGAVRRYLREFLSDPRVVEIPKPIWWPILNGIVLPIRGPRSAHAYASIWTEQGSPLMALTRALTAEVARQMAARHPDVVVDFAMTYGSPSLPERIAALKAQGIERIRILPLYPQYSGTSTGSVFDAMAKYLLKERALPEVHFIRDYFDHPAYITAIAERIRHFWREEGRAPFLLMSFHGLPRRNVDLGDPYRSQCETTARLVAQQLGLKDGEWQLVFQSRFGKQEWLKPYCVDALRELPGRGVQALDVVCPGFAVDCLETLEEIAIANKEVFEAAGGTAYRMIPALNDSPEHAAALLQVIADKAMAI
jgi:ferrochelatase